MPPRIDAAEAKRIVRKMAGTVAVPVLLEKIILTLTNHPVVLKMLAQSHPDMSELDIQKNLAELVRSIQLLRQWASTKNLSKEDIDSEAPPLVPDVFDDLDRLHGVKAVKIFIDGGSKGNPGPASIGFVIQDLEGETLYEEGQAIGTATNNQAEYTALITALRLLAELDHPPTAYFFSDSELLVRQMTGVYKVKSPLIIPLISEAQKYRRRLPRFQITHIPREKNRRADELGNLAHKQARDAAVL